MVVIVALGITIGEKERKIDLDLEIMIRPFNPMSNLS